MGQKQTKILVTGANGFVGRAVCAKLTASGVSVRAAVRHLDRVHPPGGLESMAGVEQVEVGDVTGHTRWEGALDGVDGVVHLAARVHVMRERSRDPLEAFRQVNVEGTRNLAAQAARAGVRRMVLLSTVKVNGEATKETPFKETDPPAPQDPYAVSKWEAEQALWEVSAQSKLEGVVLRPPLMYGPGVKGNFLRLMKLVWRRVPLPLANVKNRRNLLGVDNLAFLAALCLTHPEATGKTFLAVEGEGISTPELLHKMGDALGRRPVMFPFTLGALRGGFGLVGLGRELDRLTGSLELDGSESRQLLGWDPPLTLEQNLLATAQWFKTRKTRS
ncbi:MAG: SDR family oxidoreductase [Deltaproteobacteria bacterium]|nr:SDR family oxidoreductase [Deltaproteobacteria bacterium]